MASWKLPEGTKVPDHIAMILDGNRRWARSRNLQPWEGHKAGYLALKEVARASRILGVHTFTVWAFSTENWDRPEAEINEIFILVRRALGELEKELVEEKVAFKHLGRKDRLPKDVVKKLDDLEKLTEKYKSRNVFNVALDYGGHDEILRAVNKILDAGLKTLDEKQFEKYLDTGDQPYPYVDLFIRTSGEQRTSGLLPWQMNYAEFYWELDHLPDFTPEKLREAILDYSRRRRRFGGNDAEEHLKFDPKLVASMEVNWQRLAGTGNEQKFRDMIVSYLREQYGLSKALAKTAGIHLVLALKYRERQEWQEAKAALKELYGLVRKNLGLAFEPEMVANIEVAMWQDPTEARMRELLAEKYRFSTFQASKSAHLAVLAQAEAGKGNWDKARGYFERYYAALKERVA